MKQIKGNKIQVVLPAGDGFAQRCEDRKALVVQNDDLAVDNGAFGTKALGVASPKA
ncbi:hypothetical protein NKI61_00005 [Mesorhizobium sp. M0514]|uniref:hypothetical protein n=1 Tax=Mesorhizobium sp. M0514 TaxID=2956955 RepID=UPI003335D423